MEEPITPQQKGALAKARKIREAYCTSPNCYRQCGEAILPKPNFSAPVPVQTDSRTLCRLNVAAKTVSVSIVEKYPKRERKIASFVRSAGRHFV